MEYRIKKNNKDQVLKRLSNKSEIKSLTIEKNISVILPDNLKIINQLQIYNNCNVSSQNLENINKLWVYENSNVNFPNATVKELSEKNAVVYLK